MVIDASLQNKINKKEEFMMICTRVRCLRCDVIRMASSFLSLSMTKPNVSVLFFLEMNYHLCYMYNKKE